MNQRKFIGLLNLYLDGEIDPNDATRLEHEILSNPGRRRIYSEYCRIHRATKLVYEQFRLAADDNTDSGVRTVQDAMDGARRGPQTGNRLTGAEAGRPFRRLVLWAGGLAAACAAIVFAMRISQGPGSPVAASPASVEQKVTVAADSTQPEPRRLDAKYAAPFVPESRPDPYVMDQPRSRPDPFALVRWPADFRTPGAEAKPAEMPTLRFDPPLPASLQIGDPNVPREERRELRIFRSHSATEGEPISLEPVGFQIHR